MNAVMIMEDNVGTGATHVDTATIAVSKTVELPTGRTGIIFKRGPPAQITRIASAPPIDDGSNYYSFHQELNAGQYVQRLTIPDIIDIHATRGGGLDGEMIAKTMIQFEHIPHRTLTVTSMHPNIGINNNDGSVVCKLLLPTGKLGVTFQNSLSPHPELTIRVAQVKDIKRDSFLRYMLPSEYFVETCIIPNRMELSGVDFHTLVRILKSTSSIPGRSFVLQKRLEDVRVKMASIKVILDYNRNNNSSGNMGIYFASSTQSNDPPCVSHVDYDSLLYDAIYPGQYVYSYTVRGKATYVGMNHRELRQLWMNHRCIPNRELVMTTDRPLSSEQMVVSVTLPVGKCFVLFVADIENYPMVKKVRGNSPLERYIMPGMYAKELSVPGRLNIDLRDHSAMELKTLLNDTSHLEGRILLLHKTSRL